MKSGCNCKCAQVVPLFRTSGFQGEWRILQRQSTRYTERHTKRRNSQNSRCSFVRRIRLQSRGRSVNLPGRCRLLGREATTDGRQLLAAAQKSASTRTRWWRSQKVWKAMFLCRHSLLRPGRRDPAGSEAGALHRKARSLSCPPTGSEFLIWMPVFGVQSLLEDFIHIRSHDITARDNRFFICILLVGMQPLKI